MPLVCLYATHFSAFLIYSSSYPSDYRQIVEQIAASVSPADRHAQRALAFMLTYTTQHKHALCELAHPPPPSPGNRGMAMKINKNMNVVLTLIAGKL